MDGPAFPTGRHIPASFGGLPTAKTAAGASGSALRPFGTDGFRFRDLLDIINPLQHIPVISTIYRKMTGDALDTLPRVAGGALFGGIAGAVSAVVNVVVKAASGKDIGETALAFFENGFSGNDPVNAPQDSPAMLARAPEAPDLAFNAGWRASAAMPYCDAECLDPKRSFFTDAVSKASAFPSADQAAARYAEATGLAAGGGRRLDMRG